MIFQLRKPSPSLSDDVQQILVAHFHADSSAGDSFKPFPPAPEQCIYFYPRDKVFQKNVHTSGGYQPFSIIVGPQVSSVHLRPGQNHMMIGVIFKPGALHRMLGLPMLQLFDHYVDSSLIWPREIRELEEKMNDTTDYTVMVQDVESFLTKLLQKRRVQPHSIEEVFHYMMNPAKPYSVDWLASQACLSTRQFDRKFYERIGMSPKLFERVIRFNNAVRMKDMTPGKDWLSIALHSGYYDFQHMLRDFRQFTGTTPSRLSEQDLDLYTYKQ